MLLVLGHTGFIGSTLLSKAHSMGIEAIGASRKNVDLCDALEVASFWEKIKAPCTVVICAVRNKKDCDDVSCVADNVAMVRNVMNSGRGKITSLIYLSTVDVYGSNPKLPITEKSDARPQHYYALSKLAAECAINFEDDAYPKTIFRLPGIYGEGDSFQSIISLFYKRSVETGKISLSGNVLRDYVYVGDLCNLILQCVMAPLPGLFNVATGKSLSLEEIAHLAGKISNRHTEITFSSVASKGAALDLTFDISHLKEHFPKWNPMTIARGVSHMSSFWLS